MWNLNKYYSNEIFNIGGGREYSIKYFAKKISKLVGFDEKKIIYDTSKYVGAKSKNLSINKLKKSKVNFKLTKIDEGINQVIKWYKKTLK